MRSAPVGPALEVLRGFGVSGVLRGFGVSGVPELLPGGKGGTWRVGDVVLKPSEGADESRWRAETLAAVPESSSFRVPRPGFLDARDDPWSYGDRVAWEEEPFPEGSAGASLLGPLVAARRTVHLPAQIVHGDLLGNVLFAPGTGHH